MAMGNRMNKFARHNLWYLIRISCFLENNTISCVVFLTIGINIICGPTKQVEQIVGNLLSRYLKQRDFFFVDEK